MKDDSEPTAPLSPESGRRDQDALPDAKGDSTAQQHTLPPDTFRPATEQPGLRPEPDEDPCPTSIRPIPLRSAHDQHFLRSGSLHEKRHVPAREPGWRHDASAKSPYEQHYTPSDGPTTPYASTRTQPPQQITTPRTQAAQQATTQKAQDTAPETGATQVTAPETPATQDTAPETPATQDTAPETGTTQDTAPETGATQDTTPRPQTAQDAPPKTPKLRQASASADGTGQRPAPVAAGQVAAAGRTGKRRTGKAIGVLLPLGALLAVGGIAVGVLRNTQPANQETTAAVPAVSNSASVTGTEQAIPSPVPSPTLSPTPTPAPTRTPTAPTQSPTPARTALADKPLKEVTFPKQLGQWVLKEQNKTSSFYVPEGSSKGTVQVSTNPGMKASTIQRTLGKPKQIPGGYCAPQKNSYQCYLVAQDGAIFIAGPSKDNGVQVEDFAARFLEQLS